MTIFRFHDEFCSTAVFLCCRGGSDCQALLILFGSPALPFERNGRHTRMGDERIDIVP
ncbi:hypothetical protein QUF64_00845 [Anaerolineales bacterium HSG6]|nr:hypothetical protein [Anaerolineales bacterium HSG6]